MKIKKATKKDFWEIAKIIKKEYGKKPYFEKWTEKNAIKTLNYYSKVGNIYVCIIRKSIVGAIILRKEYYNKGYHLIIKELVVDEKFQGKGIGKELVNFVEEFCRKNKIRAINLYANKKALAYKFYVKRGYKHYKHMSYFSKELK